MQLNVSRYQPYDVFNFAEAYARAALKKSGLHLKDLDWVNLVYRLDTFSRVLNIHGEIINGGRFYKTLRISDYEDPLSILRKIQND